MSDIREVIEQGDYEALRHIIDEKGQATTTELLLRERGYALLEQCIDTGEISLDVDDYDSFERSPFASLVKHTHVTDDDLSALMLLFEKVEDINEDLEDGTLLTLAIKSGADPKIIQVLIDAGCNPRCKDNAENSYLHLAVQTFYRGYGVNQQALKTSYINLLIDAGVDVNEQNSVQETPLHLCVGNNFNVPEVVTVLLEHGADPNQADKQGHSAFYRAAVEQQTPELYRLFSDYAVPEFDNSENADDGLFFAFTQMLSGMDKTGIDLLNMMLEHGAPLYQEGRSHYHESKTAFENILEADDVGILQAVLETQAAELNTPGNNGNTPLHTVCAVNVNFDTAKARVLHRKVKLLLDAGADASITNDADETPADLAMDDNLKAKTVKLLLAEKN